MNNHKVNFFINLTHGCMILLFILALTSCSMPKPTNNINGTEEEVKPYDNTPDIKVECFNLINTFTNRGVMTKCIIGDTICYDTGYKGGISCIKQ